MAGRKVKEEGAVMTMKRWRSFGSPLTRWEPLGDLGEIQHEVSRLFDDFFGRQAMGPAPERTWAPLCDMHETKDDIEKRTSRSPSPVTCSP